MLKRNSSRLMLIAVLASSLLSSQIQAQEVDPGCQAAIEALQATLQLTNENHQLAVKTKNANSLLAKSAAELPKDKKVAIEPIKESFKVSIADNKELRVLALKVVQDACGVVEDEGAGEV